ncbi:Hypothetical protein PENO1_090790 [Penicillium occitanis (nom. inval.)]|nr:Hypothetical protein PENO1_090790 [Penicillium occitanis (nom. inval.)]PCG92425.1 hypothetical protein PENOC_092590 [Penicillium occitanis (nom. inval.)]
MKDVAELVGVPVPVLTRVVRMTATVRFLCEPQPNHIAHTALSASFVMKPEFLDATKFIAGTAAPAALQMASATQEIRSRELIRGSSLPLNTAQSFQSLFEQAPKLQRQWVTYLGSLAEPEIDEGATDVFRQLDWPRFGAACIIEVDSSPSIMAALIVERHPSLRITLQICENGNRPKHGADSSNNNNNNNNSLHQNSITQSNSPFVPMVTRRRHQGPPAAGSNNNIFLHRRAPGQPQTIKNAGVYILCLPPPSPRNAVSIHAIQSRLIAELRAHLGVLRENRSTILILRMRFLPEHATVDPEIECVARTRDMTLFQLANEREFEVTEVIDIIQDITDGLGKLTVVSKIRSKNNAVVALGVKFQLNASH